MTSNDSQNSSPYPSYQYLEQYRTPRKTTQYAILLNNRMTKQSHLLPGRHHVSHIPDHEGFSGLQPQDGGRVNSRVGAGNDHVLQPGQQIQLASNIQDSIPFTETPDFTEILTGSSKARTNLGPLACLELVEESSLLAADTPQVNACFPMSVTVQVQEEYQSTLTLCTSSSVLTDSLKNGELQPTE